MRYKNTTEAKLKYYKRILDEIGELKKQAQKQAAYQKENWAPGIQVLDADSASYFDAEDTECEIIE